MRMNIKEYNSEYEEIFSRYIRNLNIASILKDYEISDSSDYYNMIQKLNSLSSTITYLAIERESVVGCIIGTVKNKTRYKIGTVYALFGNNDEILSELMVTIENDFEKENCSYLEYKLPNSQQEELKLLESKGFKKHSVELCKKI